MTAAEHSTEIAVVRTYGNWHNGYWAAVVHKPTGRTLRLVGPCHAATGRERAVLEAVAWCDQNTFASEVKPCPHETKAPASAARTRPTGPRS